jgi:pimeloyl-ACP methyl ester carboxylesterase
MRIAWLAAVGLPAVLLGVPMLLTRALARGAEKKVPVAGTFIDVPGARLHYVEKGSGPVILMIHGLAAQLHNFTYGAVDLLADRYRVICVDRPGAGYSTPTTQTQPGLGEQAAIIAHFIAALGLDRPLVVGHSLGGAVSLRLALDHPGSVGALALLSPLTQRQDDVPDAFAKMVIPSPVVRHLVSRTLGIPVGWLGRRKTQAVVFAPEPCPDDFETKGGNALLFRPSSFFAASSEVSAGSGELIEMMDRYADLEVPVAILFARQDRILDPDKHGGAMPDASPRVTLDRIDGGHMFPITKPAETAAWIARKAQELAASQAPSESFSVISQRG